MSKIMSFYASPAGPASPVPSYQASSQSGGTSPYANSVRSFPSISTNPYSPAWAPSSPSSPFSYADFSVHSSPDSTNGALKGNAVVVSFNEADIEGDNFACQEKGGTTFKSAKHVEREYGSNMRALELLEATAGADVKSVIRPVRDEDIEGIRSFKSYKHAMRERGANSKALMLLQETAGCDVKCTAVPVDKNVSNAEPSDSESISEAVQKSPDGGVLHLAEATSRDNDSYSCGEYYRVSMLSRSMMTARQEAEESYMLRKKMKAMYKLKKAVEKEREVLPIREESAAEKRKDGRHNEENSREFIGSKLPENLYLSDVGNAVRSIQDDTTEDENLFKSKTYCSQERGASEKALMLLQETAGYDVKCIAVPVEKVESNIKHSSEVVDVEVTSKSSIQSFVQECHGASEAGRVRGVESPILISRQEAEESKVLRKKLKAIYKLKKATEREMTFHEQKNEKEAMAESTRKIQTNTAEDLKNADTIAAMKCSIDIERENYAKKKALQLLNDRPGCLA